jgi:hypothetical protein
MKYLSFFKKIEMKINSEEIGNGTASSLHPPAHPSLLLKHTSAENPLHGTEIKAMPIEQNPIQSPPASNVQTDKKFP